MELETLTEQAVPAAPTTEDVDLDDPALYLNRELSWLAFNQRVLAEAFDERNLLLERVKFLAITGSNLDEFYAKRVGWLKRLAATDPRMRTVDGLTVAEQLTVVLDACFQLRREMDRCWESVLKPALAAEGVTFLKYDDLTADEKQRMSDYFQEAIFPVLTPLVVDPSHPFPFISTGSLSLILSVRHPATGADRFARIKVPENRPRFVEAGPLRFVLLEDVIGANLHMLFPGMEIVDRDCMRVIRNAEMGSTGEEADDLLEVIENELKRRRLAESVTLEMEGDVHPARWELLLEELDLTEGDVYRTESALDFADLFQIASISLPNHSDPPFTPAIPSLFSNVTDSVTLFTGLREHDVLVHHPFESFDATVARFVDEAACDPAVLAIKQTMYRTSPDSPILASLIDAAGRGKEVAVLVELTARFDEANNIEWARKLESAGVHVAYGNPDQKIHSKICLVVREEVGGVTMYAHIGTGNYNSRTARLYTDLGLFTADPGICADLVRIFNYLTGFADRLETRQLLTAPSNLRSELEFRVRNEIANAKAGKPARVVFKINALEDREFTRLLYEASMAGVKVDLIIRGICRLRPGLPGLSENVRVVSVIGRFLEHSRVYRFENAGSPEFFIGSADIMKRNLDGRIEVLAPVRAAGHKHQLDALLDELLSDERQAWRLEDASWSRDETAADSGIHARLLAEAPFS